VSLALRWKVSSASGRLSTEGAVNYIAATGLLNKARNRLDFPPEIRKFNSESQEALDSMRAKLDGIERDHLARYAPLKIRRVGGNFGPQFQRKMQGLADRDDNRALACIRACKQLMNAFVRENSLVGWLDLDSFCSLATLKTA
jgi:hypothetical protein